MHLSSTLLINPSGTLANQKNYCSGNNFRNRISIVITRKLNNHLYFNISSPAHKRRFSGSAIQILCLVNVTGWQVALS